MNLSTKQIEQRDAFRASRNEYLDSADELITAIEREGREDFTGPEDARLRSMLDRARRLGRKAEGHDDTAHDPSQRGALFRAAHWIYLANGSKATARELARRGGDPEAAMVIKAAASGADTATTAWAGAIVASALGEFIPLLRPRSALFAVAPEPMAFGRHGAVIYPRMTTGSSSGFVAEGAAIPVKQNALDSFSIAPYKAAGIVVATSELMRRADAFTEAFVIGTLADDIALGVDLVFLSSGAAVAGTSPAGLFHTDNAVAAIAATAGASAQAAATDLANLLAAGAKMAQPVLLINGATAAKATQLAGASNFPLLTQLVSGRVFNAEVLFAGNLAASTVALVDRADLIVAGGDALEIDVSLHAELHMDTAPNADALAPASGGTSLYQRDMVATAVKLPITWHTKRTAAVQRVESATWA